MILNATPGDRVTIQTHRVYKGFGGTVVNAYRRARRPLIGQPRALVRLDTPLFHGEDVVDIPWKMLVRTT